MVSPPEEGSIKEAIDTDNNIIVYGSTLQSILPPQLKKMSAHYKVMCGCEWYISAKSINSLPLWGHSYLRKIKDICQNAQNRRSDENSNGLFETYKNTWCLIVDIYMQQQLTWLWLQCVHIHHPNMHWHTVNVCYVIVLIDRLLIFHTNNNTCIIPTHLLQYVLIFIPQFHRVRCMEDAY